MKKRRSRARFDAKQDTPSRLLSLVLALAGAPLRVPWEAGPAGGEARPPLRARSPDTPPTPAASRRLQQQQQEQLQQAQAQAQQAQSQQQQQRALRFGGDESPLSEWSDDEEEDGGEEKRAPLWPMGALSPRGGAAAGASARPAPHARPLLAPPALLAPPRPAPPLPPPPLAVACAASLAALLPPSSVPAMSEGELVRDALRALRGAPAARHWHAVAEPTQPQQTQQSRVVGPPHSVPHVSHAALSSLLSPVRAAAAAAAAVDAFAAAMAGDGDGAGPTMRSLAAQVAEQITAARDDCLLLHPPPGAYPLGPFAPRSAPPATLLGVAACAAALSRRAAAASAVVAAAAPPRLLARRPIPPATAAAAAAVEEARDGHTASAECAACLSALWRLVEASDPGSRIWGASLAAFVVASQPLVASLGAALDGDDADGGGGGASAAQESFLHTPLPSSGGDGDGEEEEDAAAAFWVRGVALRPLRCVPSFVGAAAAEELLEGAKAARLLRAMNRRRAAAAAAAAAEADDDGDGAVSGRQNGGGAPPDAAPSACLGGSPPVCLTMERLFVRRLSRMLRGAVAETEHEEGAAAASPPCFSSAGAWGGDDGDAARCCVSDDSSSDETGEGGAETDALLTPPALRRAAPAPLRPLPPFLAPSFAWPPVAPSDASLSSSPSALLSGPEDATPLPPLPPPPVSLRPCACPARSRLRSAGGAPCELAAWLVARTSSRPPPHHASTRAPSPSHSPNAAKTWSFRLLCPPPPGALLSHCLLAPLLSRAREASSRLSTALLSPAWRLAEEHAAMRAAFLGAAAPGFASDLAAALDPLHPRLQPQRATHPPAPDSAAGDGWQAAAANVSAAVSFWAVGALEPVLAPCRSGRLALLPAPPPAAPPPPSPPLPPSHPHPNAAAAAAPASAGDGDDDELSLLDSYPLRPSPARLSPLPPPPRVRLAFRPAWPLGAVIPPPQVALFSAAALHLARLRSAASALDARASDRLRPCRDNTLLLRRRRERGGSGRSGGGEYDDNGGVCGDSPPQTPARPASRLRIAAEADARRLVASLLSHALHRCVAPAEASLAAALACATSVGAMRRAASAFGDALVRAAFLAPGHPLSAEVGPRVARIVACAAALGAGATFGGGGCGGGGGGDGGEGGSDEEADTDDGRATTTDGGGGGGDGAGLAQLVAEMRASRLHLVGALSIAAARAPPPGGDAWGVAGDAESLLEALGV